MLWVLNSECLANSDFIEKFKLRFGKPPTKKLRGYDLVLDLLLRAAVAKGLENMPTLGETNIDPSNLL